jgi:ribonucleotide reductase alpha subunit
MRDRAYLYSVELAKERGAFPLFNADLYLSGGNFASRLPEAKSRQKIRKHGIRNSHLLSIAPTGTISAWPSPTTPRTASSRRSRGPTRARSACPTAR